MPTKLVLTALALTLLLVQDVAHALVTVKKQQLVSDGAGQQGAPMRKQPLHPSAQALLKQGLLDRRTYALHQPLDRVNVHNVRSTEEPRIQFRVDRNTLRESGQWFEVSWQGVEAPAISDWIALWVPATANHSQTAPSKWRLAAECLSHLSTGAGRLRFKLINYRQPMRFAFMRGGFDKPLVAALSEVVHVERPNEPLQAHLALTGKQGEMQLQWTSFNATQPAVRWGERPGHLTQHARADASAYSQQDMCGAPATTVGWVDAGTQHVAVMQGLTPGKRYYYVYGDEIEGFSTERSFLVPAKPGPSMPVRILAVADMGQAEADGSIASSSMIPSLNTTRMMAEEVAQGEGGDKPYSLLLHTGDISYARGYSTQWDNYFIQLEPVASRVPFMLGVGNHERNWPGSGDRWGSMGVFDSGGECGVPYERRARMPLPGPDKLWYSFDHGPVHFLMYSTEHDVQPGSEQYDFIKQDLASVDRQVTPWLIVGGHRPPYISSNFNTPPAGDNPVAQYLRDSLEGLFMQHKVDLTLHGHHHSYQRTCPVYQGVCQGMAPDGSARGPVHLVIGNGGAGLTMGFQQPSPAWLEAMYLWWGYLRIDISAHELRAEMVSVMDGKVKDTLVLRKPSSSVS